MSRIIVDPKVRHGKPVIKGTRVPIDVILESLVSGTPVDEVTEDYEITRDYVLATIKYAAKLTSREEKEEQVQFIKV